MSWQRVFQLWEILKQEVKSSSSEKPRKNEDGRQSSGGK